MLDGFLDGALGDLVEDDAVHGLVVQRILFLEQLEQVPGNSLAFAIRVSREIQRVGFLQRAHDRVDVFLVALDDLVLHGEAILGVDRAFLRHEIAHVPVRGQDLEVLAEILLMVFALAGDSTMTRFLDIY